jgi:hypothetical protein
MTTFSLSNPDFEVPPASVFVFSWGGLADNEIVRQLSFQSQFLSFFRYLIENLQSTPTEHPNWRPWSLGLSLRAGALKVYVQSAVSIIEGALAELGARRGYGKGATLHKKTYGALLKLWKDRSEEEISPVWAQLQLLKEYRNFVHLGNAAGSEGANWKAILGRETDLFKACDDVISWLSSKCDGLPEFSESAVATR